MLLAAVRHLHIRMDYELDLTKFLLLQLVCRGSNAVKVILLGYAFL